MRAEVFRSKKASIHKSLLLKLIVIFFESVSCPQLFDNHEHHEQS